VHLFTQSDIIRAISCLTHLNISVSMTFRILHRSYTARNDILFVFSSSTEQRCTSDGEMLCHAALCAAMKMAPLASRGFQGAYDAWLRSYTVSSRSMGQIYESDSEPYLWVRF
jgi:hypothetical protein